MNAPRNLIFLFALVFILFGFSLIITIFSRIGDVLAEHTRPYFSIDTPLNLLLVAYTANLKNTLAVFFSYLVALSIVSSFANPQSFISWLVSSVAGVILAPLLIYTGGYVIGLIYATGGELLFDFAKTFFDNWVLIIVANFFAGLLSFALIKG